MGSVLIKGRRRFDRQTQREIYEIQGRACSDSITRQGILQQPPMLRARTISELQMELTLLTPGLQDEMIMLCGLGPLQL